MEQILARFGKIEEQNNQIFEELKAIRKEIRTFLKTEAPKETPPIEIIDYTDRSFVVVGDTKLYAEDLKALGGRWNPNLNVPGGKGWIFSKRHLEDVEKFFS